MIDLTNKKILCTGKIVCMHLCPYCGTYVEDMPHGCTKEIWTLRPVKGKVM